MADIKISGLPAAGAATGTMELEVNDSGASKKVTAAQIKTYIGAEPADATILKDADIDSTVQSYDTATLKANTSDTLTVGFDVTANDAGTKASGTYTPDPADQNFQYAVNGGAHTLAPPTSDCTLVIQYTNDASAGAITTTGFTVVDGEFTTTDGDDFLCYIARCNGFSHLNIVALQ